MRREDELDETEEDSEPTGGELVIARRTEPGTAPGTLVVDPEAPPTVLRVIAFAPAAVDDLGEVAITEIPGLLAREDRVTWIDVVGLGDAVVLESLAAAIGMHRLVLGNFTRQEDYAAIGKPLGLEVVREFPMGVVLYRRVSQGEEAEGVERGNP